MTEQLWLAILSSSVISGILGALIAGAYALRGKRNEYINDYYKAVIQRRLAAYEQLEFLIVALKSSVLASDNRPYHILFSKDDDWVSSYQLIQNVMSQGLWVSDEVFDKMRDLNYLVFRHNPSDSSVIAFGKDNYEAIATLRADLERILATDLLELHNVENFLMRKSKNIHGFHSVQLHS
jgi:hypothetical protein